MANFLSAFAVWTGAVVGLLKIIDWILLDSHKNWLTDKFETIWLWLSEQRMGRYISLVKNHRVQIGFSIFSHLMLASFVYLQFSAFDADSLQDFYSGYTIFRYSHWINGAAFIFSAIYVSRSLHPRITHWITDAANLRQYYWRAFEAYMTSATAVFLLGLVTFPLSLLLMVIDAILSDQFVVLSLAFYTIFAMVFSPVIVESFMLSVILSLSICWFIFVLFLIGVFRVSQFILIRIVENKNGPVLALSGLLVGIGAIVKSAVA